MCVRLIDCRCSLNRHKKNKGAVHHHLHPLIWGRVAGAAARAGGPRLPFSLPLQGSCADVNPPNKSLFQRPLGPQHTNSFSARESQRTTFNRLAGKNRISYSCFVFFRALQRNSSEESIRFHQSRANHESLFPVRFVSQSYAIISRETPES